MSNKTILQNHNEIISNNNISIDDLIESINNLPEAGAGGEEIDPTVPSWVKTITEENINNWNGKATIAQMEQYINENKDELKGEQGPQGPQGETGATGATGPQGEQGPAGKDGTNGTDGYTPVKGTDYYTAADKEEMVNLVLARVVDGDEVSY